MCGRGPARPGPCAAAPGRRGRPGAVVGGRGWRPPVPRLAGAPRVSHESHAPHRGRGSGRPFNPPEGRLSESVAKAPIAPGRRRRIIDIPRFHSRPIRSRGAFATDSDTPPPRTVPGAPPAPHRARPPPPPQRRRTHGPRMRQTKQESNGPGIAVRAEAQRGPGSRPHQGESVHEKAAGVGRDGGTAEGPDRDRVTRLTGAIPGSRAPAHPASGRHPTDRSRPGR